MAFENITGLSGLQNTSTVISAAVTTSPPLLSSVLLKVNNKVASELFPVTVLLWLYLFVGILGNGLVLFVYWTNKKPGREDRYFIPFLALVDLASCIVSAGSGIFAQMYPLIFDSDVGCKTAAFLGIAFAGLSGNMLTLIAVERYLKLCRPFGRQITRTRKQISMTILSLFSLAMAVPGLFIYASEKVPVPVNPGFGIQGWKCIDIQDNTHAKTQLAYKIMLLVITYLTLFALLFFYANIVKVICTHSRRRLWLRSSISTTSSGSHTREEEVNIDITEMATIKQDSNENANDKDNVTGKDKAFNTDLSNKSTPRKLSSAEPFRAKRKQSILSTTGSMRGKGSGTDRQGIRLTVIFAVITLIYFVTYGPKVALMMEQTINKDFWSTIPLSQLAFYRFLHTFFIFNNIINPIVYALMDKRFRKDCKKRFSICK